LLSALAQHARTDRSGRAAQLTAALAWRFGVADPAAQRLLELSCLCARPLPLALLMTASGASDPELARVLCRAQLARRLEVAGEPAIEPYHVRIRDAVLATLDPAAKREVHAALAALLNRDAQRWPEALAEHLFASGDHVGGARVATRAAQAAEEQLAFDRSALLYEVALREGKPARKQQLRWLLARAHALRRAGRSLETVDALCAASRISDPAAGCEYLRQAGELLVYAGEVERGLALLAPMLERAGLALPADAAEAAERGLAAFGVLAQRGFARAPRSEAADAPSLERFELCSALANALALVDVRGVPFAILALLEAFALDEPLRLQRALCSFVSMTASLFFNPLLEPALELCRELSAEIDTPHARALLHAAEGEVAHFAGKYLQAEAAFERSERILLEACVGMNRELAAVRNGVALIEYLQKNDFQSQLALTLSWQADAQARRDLLHENVLRIAHAAVWIAQDDPVRARGELTHAARAFSGRTGAYEVGILELLDTLDRYEGRPEVHLRPLQGREDILHSSVAASPYLAGFIQFQRAWGAIRALARCEHGGDERALARSAIAAMYALPSDVGQAMGDAFQANLDYLAGQCEVALLSLQRAESTFRRLHMPGQAACARMRRGELSGGEIGARLVSEAGAALSQLGVRRPDRWTRAVFSPFEPERAAELTLVSCAEQQDRRA
jgi:hypothetical protein